MALAKKGGGVRPIAVGSVWRRLAIKCALSMVLERVKGLLHPQQLGVGVKGGVEAAIHSVRCCQIAEVSLRLILKMRLIR